MTQTTMRRTAAALAWAASLALPLRAEAAGLGGDFSGVLERAQSWLAGLAAWLTPAGAPHPADASAPQSRTGAFRRDGIHIDPDGRTQGDPSHDDGDGCNHSHG